MELPEEQGPVTHKDLTYVKNIVSRYVEMIEKGLNERMEIMERSIEAIEKQIATLSVAFGEQAVLIEALVGQIKYSDKGEREEFHNTIKEKREEMLGVMKQGAAALFGEDSAVTAAMEELVSEDSADQTD